MMAVAPVYAQKTDGTVTTPVCPMNLSVSQARPFEMKTAWTAAARHKAKSCVAVKMNGPVLIADAWAMDNGVVMNLRPPIAVSKTSNAEWWIVSQRFAVPMKTVAVCAQALKCASITSLIHADASIQSANSRMKPQPSPALNDGLIKPGPSN